jgi:hypothetical protein
VPGGRCLRPPLSTTSRRQSAVEQRGRPPPRERDGLGETPAPVAGTRLTATVDADGNGARSRLAVHQAAGGVMPPVVSTEASSTGRMAASAGGICRTCGLLLLRWPPRSSVRAVRQRRRPHQRSAAARRPVESGPMATNATSRLDQTALMQRSCDLERRRRWHSHPFRHARLRSSPGRPGARLHTPPIG